MDCHFFLLFSMIDHMGDLLWLLIWLRLMLSVVRYDLPVSFSLLVSQEYREQDIRFFFTVIVIMTVIMSLLCLLRAVYESVVLAIFMFHYNTLYVVLSSLECRFCGTVFRCFSLSFLNYFVMIGLYCSKEIFLPYLKELRKEY